MVFLLSPAVVQPQTSQVKTKVLCRQTSKLSIVFGLSVHHQQPIGYY
jgi:hypothetical protein